MVQKGNLAKFESYFISETRGATWTKIDLHAFTSTSTCMNLLSWFYFLTSMDYSPWSEREIWPNLKSCNISKTEEATPTNLVCSIKHPPLLAWISWDNSIWFYFQHPWERETKMKMKRSSLQNLVPMYTLTCKCTCFCCI